jgi:hypothetical protein
MNGGRLIGLLGGLLVFPGLSLAQKPAKKGPSVAITNIRVDVNTERVQVRYDVAGLQPDDSVYLEIESQRRGQLNARTLTGDVGKGLLSGKNKTVVWPYRLDGLRIDDPIQVLFHVKQLALPAVPPGGGPAYALLSVVAPGVGTIFVQPGRNVGLRPLITGSYLGLWAFGIVQKNRSNQAYDRYERERDEAAYAQANRQHHQYLLATGAAVALLVADVGYTFWKGRKNTKLQRVTTPGLAIDVVGATPTVGLRVRF